MTEWRGIAGFVRDCFGWTLSRSPAARRTALQALRLPRARLDASAATADDAAMAASGGALDGEELPPIDVLIVVALEDELDAVLA